MKTSTAATVAPVATVADLVAVAAASEDLEAVAAERCKQRECKKIAFYLHE